MAARAEAASCEGVRAVSSNTIKILGIPLKPLDIDETD
jgi:hypothetical protein